MPGLKGRGVSIFPALPQRRELPSDPVVHGIVRRFAQADQVPELVCILGIILGRPYVVNNLGLDSSSVPGSLLTAVTISTERLGANSLPAPVFAAVVKTHTRTPGPFLPRAPAIASALSGKRKRAGGQATNTLMCLSLAPALKALAPTDVDPMFGFAETAEDDQISRRRVQLDLEQLFIAAAGRALEEPVFHC